MTIVGLEGYEWGNHVNKYVGYRPAFVRLPSKKRMAFSIAVGPLVSVDASGAEWERSYNIARYNLRMRMRRPRHMPRYVNGRLRSRK